MLHCPRHLDLGPEVEGCQLQLQLPSLMHAQRAAFIWRIAAAHDHATCRDACMRTFWVIGWTTAQQSLCPYAQLRLECMTAYACPFQGPASASWLFLYGSSTWKPLEPMRRLFALRGMCARVMTAPGAWKPPRSSSGHCPSWSTVQQATSWCGG